MERVSSSALDTGGRRQGADGGNLAGSNGHTAVVAVRTKLLAVFASGAQRMRRGGAGHR